MKTFEDFVRDQYYHHLAEGLVIVNADIEGLCEHVLTAVKNNRQLEDEKIVEFFGGLRNMWNTAKGMASQVAGDAKNYAANKMGGVQAYGQQVRAAGQGQRQVGQVQAAMNHIVQMGNELKGMGMNPASADKIVQKIQAGVNKVIAQSGFGQATSNAAVQRNTAGFGDVPQQAAPAAAPGNSAGFGDVA